MIAATTPTEVEIFRITVIIHAMKLYLSTGGRIRASRAYTLTNMIRAAEDITGQKFPRTRKGLAAAKEALISKREELRNVQG